MVNVGGSTDTLELREPDLSDSKRKTKNKEESFEKCKTLEGPEFFLLQKYLPRVLK